MRAKHIPKSVSCTVRRSNWSHSRKVLQRESDYTVGPTAVPISRPCYAGPAPVSAAPICTGNPRRPRASTEQDGLLRPGLNVQDSRILGTRQTRRRRTPKTNPCQNQGSGAGKDILRRPPQDEGHQSWDLRAEKDIMIELCTFYASFVIMLATWT